MSRADASNALLIFACGELNVSPAAAYNPLTDRDPIFRGYIPHGK